MAQDLVDRYAGEERRRNPRVAEEMCRARDAVIGNEDLSEQYA